MNVKISNVSAKRATSSSVKGRVLQDPEGRYERKPGKEACLVRKAEALKDSTDWKATADELTKLQKEWKTIGPVAKKYSDAVWKRFISACDYFFEQKNKATSSQRSVEQENLEKKKPSSRN